MATDIILDEESGTQVTIRAHGVKAEGSDFILDAPDRRSAGSAPQGRRRALVHDSSDGLTINFAGDYPGGVTINDVVSINPKALSVTPKLVVKGGIQFEVERTGGGGLGPGGFPRPLTAPIRQTVDLQELIDHLTAQVNELTARVSALEARR